jgi:hypothetical protein
LTPPWSHREAHRRGLARCLDTGEGPILGRRIEIEAQRSGGSLAPGEAFIAKPFTPDDLVRKVRALLEA